MLILKSPSENKNYCTHPAQQQKNETSSVYTNTTLHEGFAAEALIMLLEIWTLKCKG